MRIIATSALATLALACGSDAKEGDASTTAGNAEMVVELDDLLVGYEDWPQVDAGIFSSNAGHGAYVENWLNQTALDTVNAGAGGDMPDGAILVKHGLQRRSGHRQEEPDRDVEDGRGVVLGAVRRHRGEQGG
jgi:hypothetical protein